MGWSNHSGEKWPQEIYFFIDQICTIGIGQLEFVGHGESSGGARLNAQAAENAPKIVDLVHATIALTR